MLQSLFDIRDFVMMSLSLDVYIGCAMYMLQQNSTNSGDIIHPTFQNFLVDSTMNQYLLMLGDFHTDGF